MNKKNKTDLSHLSGISAHERARELRKAILMMTYRYRFVSDSTIADVLKYEYGVNRQRYGSQLARNGFLITHQVKSGYYVEGSRQVYSLSKEGVTEVARLGLAQATWDQAKPAWSTMQHTLDLQRIAARLNETNIDSYGWLTEAETRERLVNEQIIPDLAFAFRPPHYIVDVASWVELERSAKNDIRLDYMVNRYANFFRQQDSVRGNDPKPDTGLYNNYGLAAVLILVMTDYQRERYQARFESEELRKVVIDEKNRRLKYEANTFINAKEMIGGRVIVQTIDDFYRSNHANDNEMASHLRTFNWAPG